MAIYSDLNSINPTQSPLITEVEDVYQSLMNILNTIPGDRLFNPDFGFDLEPELFELINDLTAFSVYSTVFDAVTRWESRVSVDNARSKVIPVPEKRMYELELYFNIRGISDQTFSFIGSFTQ